MLTRLRTRLVGARSRRDPLGPRAERIASRYLRRAGYKVVRRNFHVSMGEADLVCLSPDRNTLVIVEVKARRVVEGQAHYLPESAITIHKRRKLLHVAAATASRLRWGDRALRIDVVAIEVGERGKPSVRHHLSAVTS